MVFSVPLPSSLLKLPIRVVSEREKLFVFKCGGTQWRSPVQVKKLIFLIFLETIVSELKVSISNKRSLTWTMLFKKKIL